MTKNHSLVATGPGGQPLSPEQRRFNQLLGKLDKARAELQAWQQQVPLFRQGYAERVAPLQAGLLACQATLIRRLEALLHDARIKWSKPDRRRIASDLCDLALGLVESTDDEALADEMKLVFRRHAGHDIEVEQREAMAAMKDLYETVSGVDLGDAEFDSEEDLLRAARQQMAQDDERRAQRRAARQPTAAQRRREREQAEASQSLREVYRKLAAAIHPDRADDEADRERRHALMQRANQAHDARDLLALLSLQLEIEQVDASQLARTTAERAKAYCRLLADQLREVEDELHGRRIALCHEHGLDPMSPPRVDQLGAQLDRLVRVHRADLAQAQRDIAQLDDQAQARDILRRRWRREDHEMPF